MNLLHNDLDPHLLAEVPRSFLVMSDVVSRLEQVYRGFGQTGPWVPCGFCCPSSKSHWKDLD